MQSLHPKHGSSQGDCTNQQLMFLNPILHCRAVSFLHKVQEGKLPVMLWQVDFDRPDGIANLCRIQINHQGEGLQERPAFPASIALLRGVRRFSSLRLDLSRF